MMMKNIFIFVCCATLTFISTIAYSAGPYISDSIGLSLPNDSDVTDSGLTARVESDNGLGVAVALGYDAEFIRYEVEYAYQKNDMDNISAAGGSASIGGDVLSKGVLLNFYYDIRTKNSFVFVPYITAGLGYANVEVSPISAPGYGPVTTSSYDDNVYAYQFGAGFGIPINEFTTFDLKYRYFATSDPDLNGTSIKYSSNNIYAGIRVNF